MAIYFVNKFSETKVLRGSQGFVFTAHIDGEWHHDTRRWKEEIAELVQTREIQGLERR